MMSETDIFERWKSSPQAHVLQFLPTLSDGEKAQLQSELQALEDDLGGWEGVARIHERAYAQEKAAKEGCSTFSPLNPDQLLSADPNSDERKWRGDGLKEIAAGRIAALLLAGGQGTRLGSKDPKGMYDIGLPSRKSLFQIQAERLRRLKHLAASEKNEGGISIPWYIMTSDSTREQTQKFFADNRYFGLPAADVILFEQSTLPATTIDGKLIMSTKSTIMRAPDGNGGVYAALKHQNVLDDMKRRGIETVFAYGVDNVLVKVCDPAFVGCFVSQRADCGAKVVIKSNPEERVGVYGLRNGKVDIVEYSEMTLEMSSRKDSSGQLMFRAANIVTHIYSRDFLSRFVATEESLSRMTLHIAKKNIPSVNDAGDNCTIEGVKFEQFIFDAFKFADTFMAYEGKREEEFSPVKNKIGSDSPTTALRDLCALHSSYIKASGGIIEAGEDQRVEISPLVTYSGEGLEPICKGKTFTTPVHISISDTSKKRKLSNGDAQDCGEDSKLAKTSTD